PLMHSPTSHFIPYGLLRLAADGWGKADEELPILVSDWSRPEGVAQKVELGVLIPPLAVRVLAVHDPRFLLADGQFAFRQPFFNLPLQFLHLRQATTVDHDIIRVSLEADIRMLPFHPHVEGVVQVQIGKGLMTPPCGVPLSLS